MSNLRLYAVSSQGSELKRILLFLAILALMGATIYAGFLSEILYEVLGREDSSHGIFVPFISLYFIWHKRALLRKRGTDCDIGSGLPVFVSGFLLFFVGRVLNCSYLEVFSFAIVLSGLVICFFGKGVFTEVFFAIVFLMCMIPVPDQHVHSVPISTDP